MSRSFKKNPSFNPFRGGVRKIAKRRANKRLRAQKHTRGTCGNHSMYRRLFNRCDTEWLKSWYGWDFKDWINLFATEEDNYDELVNDWKRRYKRK
jgi:hypothetical protein